MDADKPKAACTLLPTQLVALLDAGWHMPSPPTYFDDAASLFRASGREEDARSVAWLGCLFAEHEIEVLLRLRAAWKRGQARSPADAGRSPSRALLLSNRRLR